MIQLQRNKNITIIKLPSQVIITNQINRKRYKRLCRNADDPRQLLKALRKYLNR